MDDTQPEPLDHRVFTNRTLRASRFIGCDLAGVVVRGSEVAGMQIDSPRLTEAGSSLVVNGVDVVPIVDAELNRRFPGRELRNATDPAGLRAAWDALEGTWTATTARAGALPEGMPDASVEGEWSFAQTLRHLVMATDTWLGKAILQREQPYDPVGVPSGDGEDTVAYESAVFSAETPGFDAVLEVRAGRRAMVRAFLAGATPADLAAPRKNPHAPEHAETVLSCLHTILEEEWEHHRYAVRDLDALAAEDARPR